MQTIYAFSYNPAIATGTNTTGTNWRMAYQHPIMLYKGTSNLFRLVVFSVKQKVVDLTNHSIQVQIVDKETREHFVTKTATITAPTSGVATIEFTEEELRNLQNRFYHLIARLIDPDDGSSVSLGEILYLDDNYGVFTPITIEDAWNYSPTSISTVDGIPAISFTNIRETPDSFTGEAGKYLRVNSIEDSIEFSSIDYASLTNKPVLFSGSYIDLTNKPSLSAIATSGSYDDLTNKPTIPNLSATGNIIPAANNTYSLGSEINQWKDIWVSANTIYIGGAALSITNGNLTVDGNVITGGGGEGLPTITIPEEAGSTYKGLQVNYGMIHSNNGNNELNVNKIVIHKPAVTTTTIDPTSSQDDFAVTGLGDSDVLVMFVLYGNVNGPKTLSTLQAFAEAAIDNVILDDGVAGDYNTVEQMKTAFYTNYSTLAAAAGGLDQDFTFFTGNVETTVGATTVRQGSGAVFEIGDNGLGAYTPAGIQSNGTNYLAGHKILVLGTALGGVTPDNDCIITVDSISEGGLIFQWSVAGAAAGAVSAVYGPVTGTNYQTGLGFAVGSINPNNFDVNLTNVGSDYVADDQVTLPGSDLQNGTSPTNDIIIRILTVDGSGAVQSWEYLSGTVPPGTWPSNNISDGGNDQYDGANYINSSLANQISYNNGNTVVNGTAAFGAGSSYTFVYDTGIFGLLVTGNQSTSISTSGNSGADGGSTTEAGNLYGPDTAAQTFDNAVTHINFVGNPYAGAIVSFTHSDNGDEVDILIPDDGSTLGVGITRDNNNGIYNPYREGSWDSDVSPGGTLWNIDGWADFSDVESRTYAPLYEAFGFGGLGNKIVGTECVMYLPDNGKYYAVKFSAWTQNNNGGGFAYTRRELDLTSLSDGIRFSDGTRLKSAEGLSRVKLESPGARRIEEAHGFKIVSVTSRTTATAVTSTAALGNELATQFVTVGVSGSQLTALNALVNSGALYYFEVSLNQTNWFRANWGGSGATGGSAYFQLNLINEVTLPVSQGATVYYRITTGGDPAVWWDKNELPAGGANFRGAVIDYHAYTSDGTIIGTIHIVDDSGEEFITHTEVSSGGTDLENDDLWFVQNEGTISYRRIDGEQHTLKVQWTAKVFYGSEIYD